MDILMRYANTSLLVVNILLYVGGRVCDSAPVIIASNCPQAVTTVTFELQRDVVEERLDKWLQVRGTGHL